MSRPHDREGEERQPRVRRGVARADGRRDAVLRERGKGAIVGGVCCCGSEVRATPGGKDGPPGDDGVDAANDCGVGCRRGRRQL